MTRDEQSALPAFGLLWAVFGLLLVTQRYRDGSAECYPPSWFESLQVALVVGGAGAALSRRERWPAWPWLAFIGGTFVAVLALHLLVGPGIAGGCES